MKEVIKVSISGIGFDFDEDAYRIMSAYLDRLEAGYAQSPDGREIVADIETRIAELLLSSEEGEEVVRAPLASRIVERLGFPDDMPPAREPSSRLERRLYRSTDGARIGGVCCGLATFFGTDPVWIRLAVFLPLFMVIMFGVLDMNWGSSLSASLFGIVAMLYFIMWFAVPAARTPRQKLEMRGEKVTASSIRETLATDSRTASPQASRSASVWAELAWVAGRILLFGLKALALLVAFGLAVAAVGLVIGFFAVLTVGPGDWMPVLRGITPGIYAALVILAVLLPIVLLCWLLLGALFRLRGSRTAATIIGSLWLIIAVYLGVMTVRNADSLGAGRWDWPHPACWNYYDMETD